MDGSTNGKNKHFCCFVGLWMMALMTVAGCEFVPHVLVPPSKRGTLELPGSLRGMILPYRQACTIGKRVLAVGNCNGRDFRKNSLCTMEERVQSLAQVCHTGAQS
jgi:hypothetical protein